MSKTKPTGVRFSVELLDRLKREHKISTPQKALSFLEQFYVEYADWITETSEKQAPAKPNIETKKSTPDPKHKAPKNLNELKSMCPKELSGFDRSNWIAIERQKYNI